MIIKNLNLSFGMQDVFKNININIPDNEKIGIVGVNGAGKSTFFKVLLKKLEPNSGKIEFNSKVNISLLPQVIDDEIPNLNIPVFDYLLSARPIKELEEQLATIYNDVANETDTKKQNKLMKKIDNIQNRLNYYDVYEAENILLKIISGMHIDDDLLYKNLNELSGGQKSKIAFARLLYSKPEIMLLDEPTNHLDSKSKDYIVNYLKNYHGGVFIISHDNDFLDKVTNKTLYLDKRNHNMMLYDGSYSKFMKVKKANEEALDRAILMQEKEEEKLEKIVLHYSNSSGNRKKMAQDREKKLNKLRENKLSKEKEIKKINFKIKIDKESSINPIILDKVSFSYDNKHKIINNLSFTLTRGEKFLIVGNNGVGKSTLLKLIVSKLKPNKGIIDINYKTKIAYYAQEHELLDNNKTIMDNFLDTNYSDKEIRNCLGRFMFYGDDVFKEIKTLSPGERARVMLAKISLSGANVLILDEPTNHLDPETQSKISDIFRDYEGTMLVVSHNEDFVRNLQIERMLILPEGKITFYSEDKFDKYKKVNI